MSARKITQVALTVCLVAGAVAGAFFAGKAYMAVRRDQAAFALEDGHKPKALLALRADEDARLYAGPLPIEDAMHRLSNDGRARLSSALTPQPSNDTAPLMGWGYQVHDVPDWMMASPADAGDAAVRSSSP